MNSVLIEKCQMAKYLSKLWK